VVGQGVLATVALQFLQLRIVDREFDAADDAGAA
jgi:hypothetical protein